MSEGLQHAIVLVIVLGAALFLLRHLTGWPPSLGKRTAARPVVLGERLARGLDKAKRNER